MAIAVAFVISVLVALVLYLLGKQSRRLRARLELLVTICTIFGAVSGVVFYLWDHPAARAPASSTSPSINTGTAVTSGGNSQVVTGSGNAVNPVTVKGDANAVVTGSGNTVSVSSDGPSKKDKKR